MIVLYYVEKPSYFIIPEGNCANYSIITSYYNMNIFNIMEDN